MNIIKDHQIFAQEFMQLMELIQSGAKLPKQVFTDHFSDYLFFEYDRILFDYFATVVTHLLKALGEP